MKLYYVLNIYRHFAKLYVTLSSHDVSCFEINATVACSRESSYNCQHTSVDAVRVNADEHFAIQRTVR